MKKIYFVLTYTGTIPSRIIHIYTGKEFSHCSISLDKELNEMYSFARLHTYNPFIGGFIKENVNAGIYKRFKNTKAAIYSLEVTDRQYKKIKKEINRMKQDMKKYKYNIIGVLAASVHKKFTLDSRFYCSEFVKYLIDIGEVENNLPEVVTPHDFENIDNIELVYKGLLRDFKFDN